ncbi:acetate kinase [Pseudocolwellia agarivorans]|uniref:acetate kinase n=1 Tax=Pseudocolwellia agarivorans TaxID=1911682 RepID=UPI000985A421|nr:acetate kinase [Pseudocolwellia agarivorans]
MTKQLILVINCGSSSLKFSLINPLSTETILTGLAEQLFTDKATIKIKYKENVKVKNILAPYDHSLAIAILVDELKALGFNDNVAAIGHRVVHGGENYSAPTLITDEVKKIIESLSRLAPLHNPANLMGITACEKAFESLPQVAIFDTAFHQTLPSKAFIYGLPYELYEKHSIRRYGFHGTSHYFVSTEAAKLINKPIEACNFISAHLGNGCSITAIKNGKSADTSLGFTPNEGVMMGTRSGDVDSGIIFYLVNELGYPIDDVNKILNSKSGLLGVSGISNDCRTLEEAMTDEPNCRATLALTVFSYRIAKVIASYTASLSELDGIIFTGGIGENSMLVRKMVISHLQILNFHIDDERNEQARFGQSGNIAANNSRSCWVIPTNEEFVIAEQTQQLLSLNNEGE